MSLRSSRTQFPWKTETCAPCIDRPPASTTFSRLSFFLPHAHARKSHTDVQKRTNVVLLLATSPRYHFQARSRSSYDHSFPPSRASSHFSFSPRRISTAWLFFDGGFDIDTLYHREYITGLPSNIRTRMHYAPQFAVRDGYIRDCDLRYRKLLSKARPKTRGGCIKLLNSGMTATRRRCLP